MHSANSKLTIFRLAFISLLSFLMFSCATINKNYENYAKGNQPGDILYNYVHTNISNNNTVNSLLADYKGPKNLSTVVEKYEDEIALLYKQHVIIRRSVGRFQGSRPPPCLSASSKATDESSFGTGN